MLRFWKGYFDIAALPPTTDINARCFAFFVFFSQKHPPGSICWKHLCLSCCRKTVYFKLPVVWADSLGPFLHHAMSAWRLLHSAHCADLPWFTEAAGSSLLSSRGVISTDTLFSSCPHPGHCELTPRPASWYSWRATAVLETKRRGMDLVNEKCNTERGDQKNK